MFKSNKLLGTQLRHYYVWLVPHVRAASQTIALALENTRYCVARNSRVLINANVHNEFCFNPGSDCKRYECALFEESHESTRGACCKCAHEGGKLLIEVGAVVLQHATAATACQIELEECANVFAYVK